MFQFRVIYVGACLSFLFNLFIFEPLALGATSIEENLQNYDRILFKRLVGSSSSMDFDRLHRSRKRFLFLKELCLQQHQSNQIPSYCVYLLEDRNLAKALQKVPVVEEKLLAICEQRARASLRLQELRLLLKLLKPGSRCHRVGQARYMVVKYRSLDGSSNPDPN